MKEQSIQSERRFRALIFLFDKQITDLQMKTYSKKLAKYESSILIGVMLCRQHMLCSEGKRILSEKLFYSNLSSVLRKNLCIGPLFQKILRSPLAKWYELHLF